MEHQNQRIDISRNPDHSRRTILFSLSSIHRGHCNSMELRIELFEERRLEKVCQGNNQGFFHMPSEKSSSTVIDTNVNKASFNFNMSCTSHVFILKVTNLNNH